MPGDIDAALLSSPQSAIMTRPTTIVTAATIAPTSLLTLISGTTAIATITPPIAGAHVIWFVFTTTQNGQFATTGNIQSSTTTATANVPIPFVYNPTTNKYYYQGA